MDFESVAEEVHTAPRADFVTLRDARARQARDSGDVALATRIRELRKPSVAAWLINHVSRERPADVARLLDLSAALHTAHTTLAGDELRSLSRQRRELIAALTELARATAAAAGSPMSEAVAWQVQQTLEVASTDPDAAALLRAGRLTVALEADGSAAWLTSAAAPAEARKVKPSKEKSTPGRAEELRRRELDKAQARAEATAADRAAAVQALAEAEAERAEAGAAIDELRASLDEARRRERQCGETVRAARKSLDHAEHAAAAARRRLDELRQQSPTL